ncbi:epoxide hydrolase [Penicillium verhagenii]|uniref:epoxide hydrolase n=1 Tax=Penicillium verhagenii TaxID=1562060 RepID=UPI002544DC6B|nr:epoxide hydrolase [Penicillium verhagenii]KAJ5924110.1 epoxide hydrolase [Penicillium verhagenii]
MAAKFNLPPKNPANLRPFEFHIPESEAVGFKTLLKLSKIGPATWWNQQNNSQFGVSREWLIKAKETWLTSFDWRNHEDYINKFPNFKIAVQDLDIGEMDIHFAALFSAKHDAIPIIFMHGFPSSFADFLPMMDLLADKYTPETLPYHIIVPSLPDYGLSGTRAQNTEMTLERSARIMNQLMIDLGFGSGYIAQGGDLGSLLARIMSAEYEQCKAFHLNMLVLDPGQAVPSSDSLTSEERHHLKRTEEWRLTGMAYALEHGTRPSTAGLAISSSPLALLAWIGEKLMEWTDPRKPFSLDQILATVTLYWFTGTFSTSLYHATAAMRYLGNTAFPISKEKPLGYSWFPYDLVVFPRSWAQEIYPKMVCYKSHSNGGHFPCLEEVEEFVEDIEAFVEKVSDSFNAVQDQMS